MPFTPFTPMIGYLEGTLFFKTSHYVLLVLNGVGYQLEVPLTTFSDLPSQGEKAKLYVHTYLKENILKLYGFSSLEEKDLFSTLIEVPGIGPRLALNILSRISLDEFNKMIVENDINRVKVIPGIGQRIAQRLFLELKDKWKPTKIRLVKEERVEDTICKDALSALVNLGYQRQEASQALEKALKNFSTQPSLEDLIKEVLKRL
jgi:Holliday junction DNA helicase RuvA